MSSAVAATTSSSGKSDDEGGSPPNAKTTTTKRRTRRTTGSTDNSSSSGESFLTTTAGGGDGTSSLAARRHRANTAPDMLTKSPTTHDDDEELKMAQAMAFAAQQNPNVSPEAIRKMVVGAPPPPTTTTNRSSSTTTNPAKESLAAASAKLSNLFLKNNVQEQNTMMMEQQELKEQQTMAPSSSNNKATKGARTGFSKMAESFKQSTTFKVFHNIHHHHNNKTDASSGYNPMTTTTTATATSISRSEGANRPGGGFLTTITAPASTSLSLPRNSATNSILEGSSSTTAVPGPPEIAQSVSGGQEAVAAAVATTTTITSSLTGVERSGSMQQHQSTEGSFIPPPTTTTKSDPIRLATLAWKRRGGMGKYNTLNIMGGSSSGAWELRRIELAGTRLLYYLKDEQEEAAAASGMVDASMNDEGVTAAADSADDDNPDVVPVHRPSTWLEQSVANFVNTAIMSSSSANNNTATAGGGRSSSMTAGAMTGTSSYLAAADPTQPRGYLDLRKEKATVHAAFGLQGAPSPFALSIKVRGETKWKLCFDYHKTQMEWLAAITDVVVQTSVDSYNASLLAAADPHNQEQLLNPLMPNIAVSAAPCEPPPAATGGGGKGDEQQQQGGGGHRLWMLDSYTIDSATGMREAGDEDDEEDEEDNASMVDDDMDPDPVFAEIMSSRRASGSSVLSLTAATAATTTSQKTLAAQQAAVDQTELVMSVPQDKLVFLACWINLAMACSRASGTSMEGFWLLVVIINMGLLLFCMVPEPDWKGVLQHVTASASSSPTTKKKKAAVNNSKGGKSNNPHGKGKPKQDNNNAFIPTAGTSTVKLKNTTDAPVNAQNQVFAGWRDPPGKTMLLRSHEYLVTKQKVPSPGELYECVNVDIFESPQRHPDMSTLVKLPECNFTDSTAKKTWRSPDIFVISIALPTDPPKFGKSTSDGGGYTITLYLRMRQETRDILKRVTADGYDYYASEDAGKIDDTSKVNAVRLLEEWCRRAPTDPKWQARFKCVPNAHNLKEIGMPTWISKYNGKPFLIKRAGETGFLYVHPELSCVEFDISLHPFPYLAKQAICFMKDAYFKKILVSFGFVIEGRAQDELPECLIGLMQLCYPDPMHALQAESFFDGTAPRSF